MMTVFSALLPLAVNAAVVTKNMVTDYGMLESDAKPAIVDALRDAKNYLTANPDDEVIIYFPAGTWNVLHPTSEGIFIGSWPNGKLTLRGESSSLTKLVFSQFDERGIMIKNTSNVTVEKMHLTRPRLYTTQGDVVSVSNGTVRVQLHEGFPDPVWLAEQPGSLGHERVLQPFEGDPLNPVNSAVSKKILFDGVVDVGGGLYDFTINSTAISKSLLLAPGQQVALKCKVGTQMVFGIRADNTTVQDIRITNSSQDGVWMRESNQVIVRRITIDRGDLINGRLPFFSQPADGIHLWPTLPGGDLLVEDNTVIGTADDGIAVINTTAPLSQNDFATNIVVRNNTVKMGLARAINVNWADGAEISGNTISSLSTHGILAAGLINSVVTKNTIIDNRQEVGIELTEEGGYRPSGNRISENTFGEVNEDMHLILLQDADDTEVDLNLVSSWSSVNGNTSSNKTNPAPLTYAINCTNVYGENYLAEATAMPLVGSKVSSGITVSWSVMPAPDLRISLLESGDIELSWSTANRLNYQIQSSLTLLPDSWGDLGDSIVGLESRVSVTTPRLQAPNFYRIQIQPLK